MKGERSYPAVLFGLAVLVYCGALYGCGSIGCDAAYDGYTLELGRWFVFDNEPVAEPVGAVELLETVIQRMNTPIGEVIERECTLLFGFTNFRKFARERGTTTNWSARVGEVNYQFDNLLALNDDTASLTMNLTRTFPPEGVQPRMSSLTATGTFSADEAQAAIDQLYRGGGSPYAKFTREGLLPVNIDWTVAAVVDGESMTHNFTQAYKLEEFAIRE